MARHVPKLEDLLAGAQLPALPQSAIRLLELSQDPDNGPAEFAVPIEGDPGLTGQVLRFVNSSYFGFSREISSVKLAITLVGIRTIKNFSLWSAVFSLMPNPRCGPFDLKSLWQDSLRRALFARSMGKNFSLAEAEDLFAAGLLQDMAVPLLVKELPEQYAQLFDTRAREGRRLSELETEAFGWNHAQASGLMARMWSLPDHFISLLEGHIDWQSQLQQPELPLGHLAVSLSALLPSAVDGDWQERDLFVESYQKAVRGNLQDIGEVFQEVDKGFEEFAPLLKLSQPSTSLYEHLFPETATAS